MRKPVILIAVFLVPIGVFLFLRFFGKNEFDIPVFYTDKIEQKMDCNFEYKVPYLIPDSLAPTFHLADSKAVLVIDSTVTAKDVKSLSEDFSKDELSIISLTDFSKEKMKTLKECILFFSPAQSSVLIDNKRQIRGYYSLPKREEMDKLDVELKVLLKKY